MAGLRRLLLPLLLLGVGLCSYQLERRTEHVAGEAPLLYLPNGRYLQVVSLGFAPVVADAVYVWAIQYYSNYTRADRYRYVEHVFGDVIAVLDPNYIDPYWIGALIMTTEARDLDAGLRLLEKGMDANPDAWILPYLAAWECFQFKQYGRAESYFDRAASIPDAPAAVLRLRAGMRARQGDLRESISLWRAVLDDPRSDEISRKIAGRQIRDLTVKADIAELEERLTAFRNRYGRDARRLEELVTAGYLPFVPEDPDGEVYRIDAATGRIVSGASRLLGDR